MGDRLRVGDALDKRSVRDDVEDEVWYKRTEHYRQAAAARNRLRRSSKKTASPGRDRSI